MQNGLQRVQSSGGASDNTKQQKRCSKATLTDLLLQSSSQLQLLACQGMLHLSFLLTFSLNNQQCCSQWDISIISLDLSSKWLSQTLTGKKCCLTLLELVFNVTLCCQEACKLGLVVLQEDASAKQVLQ